MKRRIPFKTITLILGILIVVYNLYSNSNYIFTLLRVFIIISLVPWLILLARNIKFSGWLFKKRFYWFYPTTFFIVFGPRFTVAATQCPSLDAANIGFNLLKMAADGLHIGPMLLGTALPAHVLTPSVTARGILNMTALAVVEAQRLAEARG